MIPWFASKNQAKIDPAHKNLYQFWTQNLHCRAKIHPKPKTRTAEDYLKERDELREEAGDFIKEQGLDRSEDEV